MNLLRRKSVTDLQAEALTDHSLKRALGALNLTMLGIGAIIGTGIFVLTGTVAAQNAGPAVVLSFVLAGVASIFAALCYSEFASLVPMAGSAYTYGYAASTSPARSRPRAASRCTARTARPRPRSSTCQR
jgi:APA family basic amino acid/polyamine antiporter